MFLNCAFNSPDREPMCLVSILCELRLLENLPAHRLPDTLGFVHTRVPDSIKRTVSAVYDF